MTSSSEPPKILIEPEYCPQAVVEWYMLTGSNDRSTWKRDLAGKAKKHLCYMGWAFWHVNKKGRWELRYTSPNNGKNYISLRRACESCIQDGDCGPRNINFIHGTKGVVINGGSLKVEVEQHHPSTSSSPAQQPRNNAPRKCKKINVHEPRMCRKRQRVSSSDEELAQVSHPESEASSSIGGRRGKVLQLCKSVRQDDEAKSSGFSVRNPRTIVSWLIDNNVVLSESKVFCRGGNNVVKEGRLLRSGIVCDCCGAIFSLTRFEVHTGCSKHRPSSSICLEDGRSLLECQKEALQKMNHVTQGNNNFQEQNDSICSACHYGGDLMLCDGCPSSFHPSCLGLHQVPDGEWFCPHCCCKICNRHRCREDCADDVDNSFLACDQCERKYHQGCLMTRGSNNMVNKNWFCSVVCENIFFSLHKLIGKKIHLVGGCNLTWTLLKTMRGNTCGDLTHDDLEGLSQNDNKLNLALDLLHESFDPVTDGLTGRDIVADVIFSRGSGFNRLNFRGFYTVILENNNGEVTCVATLRIYGQKVAELPLVATKMGFRRQGMCRILMNELEKLLIKLGVESMILPSSHNVTDTWTNSFGFARMTDSDKSHFVDYNFLKFQDTIMCHKPLMKPSITYMA